MKFIDSHCHLNFKAFNEDRKKVITSAKKAGIEKIIAPGADLHSSYNALILAQEQENYCFARSEIHPHHANKVLNIAEDVVELEKMIDRKYVKAIGEIGLDYHIYKGQTAYSRKEIQQELLIEQIKLGDKYHLPLIIHCREAFDDLFNLLNDYKTVLEKIGGVIHCFTGGLVHLRQAASLHLMVGFDGNITYDERLQTVVKEAPVESILIETDSPWLTPIPYRGKRNEPKNVRLIAKEIAKIKELDLTKVAQITTDSAKKLFKLN